MRGAAPGPVEFTPNNGHLGILDHPDNVLAVEGAQIFIDPVANAKGRF